MLGIEKLEKIIYFTPVIDFYRYKQYRRYMKNHASDRMTFDDS